MGELVSHLKDVQIIKSARVAAAMEQVDRADFCSAPNPYGDCPEYIGYGATISAPHMHAFALELSLPELTKPNSKILDIGSGSGYLSVCYTELVGEDGKVVGIEHMPELVRLSIENTRKQFGHLLDNGTLKLVQGDGRLGFLEEAPYDVIHLISQLKPNGILIIPVGEHAQKFMRIRKRESGELDTEELFDVQYVPLTSLDAQLRR